MSTGVQLSGTAPDAAASRDAKPSRRGDDAGPPAAREEMFMRFLPLAKRVAGRYRNPYESPEELQQIACVGLLGAIDRYDPDRGASFAAFAIPTMIGEIKRHFRNTGWSAHVPRGPQELALRVDRAAVEIEQQTGEAPTPTGIADFLGLELEDVLVGLDASNAHFARSFDAPPSGGESEDIQTLHDRLGHEEQGYDLIDAKLSLQAALPRLPWAEGAALRLRLEHDLKQIEIAERLGCSQMQVSRLLRRAAHRIRGSFEREPEAA